MDTSSCLYPAPAFRGTVIADGTPKNFPGMSRGACQNPAAMKSLLILSVAGLLCLTRTAGALEIPRTVHRAPEADKATAEATAAKKGVLWVLSDASLKPT